MIASEQLVFLSVPPKWRVVAIFTLTVIFFLPTHGAAQTNWPMPGHDAQHTGRANFAGPISAPTAPLWTFSTVAPIVGDIVTSTEGTLYFASDQLYALKPDGTAFVPSVSIGVPATGPVVDDSSGLIYIAVSAADGGFDLLRLTKQLQGTVVVLHVPRPANGAIISPLVLGRGGLVFFVAGRFPGVVYAAGPVQWSNPVCPTEAGPNTPIGASANSPAVSTDGSSLFVMCGGGSGGQDGLLRLQAGTGVLVASTPTNRNSTEPALDSLQHVHSGWQAFGGAAFCGDYLTWDFSLTLLTTPAAACDSSRFTTSRAAIMPDGQSTVRIGFAFPPNNQLDTEGINNWIISTDGSTVPTFTSLPSVDAAGNIFIGNTQGIEALSPIDGHTWWSFNTGDQITTQPVIANGGALYVGSSSGKVYAFNTAPAHQSGTVYVSGSGAGFATVDLLSASVTATNNTFTDGGVVAVSPDGKRSYVSAIFGLAVVDNTTNQVITTISVGSRPEWVALSPDGSRVYVSQPNISSAPGVLQGVYVIDTTTNGIIASIPIPGPQRVAVAPDNSRVYVGSAGRGVAVVDPATNTVVRSIDILGAQTTGIAFTPDGAHAYVGEFNAPSLYLIDAHADALLQTIPLTGSLGGGVSGVIASPDGSRAYAGNVRNGPFVTAPRDVFVIDTDTNAVTGQIPVSFPSSQFAISSDGTNLLVGDGDIGNLIVASLATNFVVESIHVNDFCCPNITGIGAAPPAVVVQPPAGRLLAPSALNFGVVQQGTTLTLSIQLQNVGLGPLTITALTLDNPAFSFSEAPRQPLLIPPGTSILFSLNFSPLTLGIFNGSLSIKAASGADPTIVTLTGVAVAPPLLNVQPNSLDFGRTSIAETRKLSLTISNLGGSPLSGTTALSPSTPSIFALIGGGPFSLGAGESLALTIAFSPTDRLGYTGQLSISSNGEDARVNFAGIGERVGVVFVPGFLGDATTFGRMPELLHDFNNALETFEFLPPDRSSIERLAGELGNFIDSISSHEVDRVDIVAHSMGGLIARSYIGGLGENPAGSPAIIGASCAICVPYNGKIRKLVTVGTPNYGVPSDVQAVGDLFSTIQVKELVFNAAFQLKLHTAWRDNVIPQKRIEQNDVLNIVGTQSASPNIGLLIGDDGIVPGSSAVFPCEFLSCDTTGNDHVRFVPYKHAGIVPVPFHGTTEVDAEDGDHQTLQLIEDFLLDAPVRTTFVPPAEFTSTGMLVLHFTDTSTGRPVNAPGLLLPVLVDGRSVVPVEGDPNNGSLTIERLSPGMHQIKVELLKIDFHDPDPISVMITAGRPTVQFVDVQRRRFSFLP